MKFTIGDNVILKRTGEEGRVTAIVSKTMIEVDVKGTIFPVYTDDVDHPYFDWFTKKGTMTGKKSSGSQLQIPTEKPPTQKERLARGIYLSFLPEFAIVEMEEQATLVKVFLLNELPVSVKFHYEVRYKDALQFAHEGTIHAFGHVYLHSIPYDIMSDQPRLNWKMMDVTFKNNARAEGTLRIKPARLFQHVNDVLVGNSPSFSYMLIDEFRERPEPETPKAPQPFVRQDKTSAASTEREHPKHELDLHIEQLTPGHRGMTNAEIITLQLNTLQHYLQLAINNHLERMIVIHGLGKGKLRDEVHAVLKATPEVARYKNEWSGKYGFGATEIIFKR